MSMNNKVTNPTAQQEAQQPAYKSGKYANDAFCQFTKGYLDDESAADYLHKATHMVTENWLRVFKANEDLSEVCGSAEDLEDVLFFFRVLHDVIEDNKKAAGGTMIATM